MDGKVLGVERRRRWNAPINGPMLANGLFIDPQVPGVAAVPEPSTWALLLAAFLGVGLVGWRKAIA
jgi:hypothetical protein